MQILYVEDDIPLAKTVEIMLGKAGYEFDTVHCGQDAVDYASVNAYDLILLDIMLPDLDGYEVIGRLRGVGITAPFLIQTGLLDREQRVDASSLGVANYLIKPFDKAELLEKIEKLIGPLELPSDTEQNTTALKPAAAPEPGPGDGISAGITARLTWQGDSHCSVITLRCDGAVLRLPSEDTDTPKKLNLAFYPAPARQCEVCWRVGDKVGVKFL